jgi:hypothetical protein
LNTGKSGFEDATQPEDNKTGSSTPAGVTSPVAETEHFFVLKIDRGDG